MKILLALILFISVPIAYAVQSYPNLINIGKTTGTLTNSSATPIAIPPQYIPPYTLTLSYPSNTGRLLELSTDGGTTYFTPSYDVSTGGSSTAGEIIVSVATPITHVRFTGANGDVWSIL